MKQTLELTVAELDCADAARPIEGALSLLGGVAEVRTAVAARKAIVSFDPDRIGAAAIRQAIRDLGMTVTETDAPPAAHRRSPPNLLGWDSCRPSRS